MNATTNPVSDIIALAERLSNLLTEESTLLKTAQASEIAALQPDKAKLASAFEAQLAHLDRNRGPLDEAAPGLKAKLSRVMAAVREAIVENARLLRAARDANQKLINAIVNAVTERQNKLGVYTEAGSMTGSLYRARPASKGVSLSVDQRL
jgi:flagellar biosynthesis/type III secretory pathway chaperone